MRDKDRIELGKRLTWLRENNNMSVQHLANSTGLSTATIYTLEKGTHLAQTTTLRKLAAVLNTTVDKLTGMDELTEMRNLIPEKNYKIDKNKLFDARALARLSIRDLSNKSGLKYFKCWNLENKEAPEITEKELNSLCNILKIEPESIILKEKEYNFEGPHLAPAVICESIEISEEFPIDKATSLINQHCNIAEDDIYKTADKYAVIHSVQIKYILFKNSEDKPAMQTDIDALSSFEKVTNATEKDKINSMLFKKLRKLVIE